MQLNGTGWREVSLPTRCSHLENPRYASARHQDRSSSSQPCQGINDSLATRQVTTVTYKPQSAIVSYCCYLHTGFGTVNFGNNAPLGDESPWQ